MSFPRGEAPPPWSLPEAGPRAESRLPRAVTSPRSEGESALAVFLRHVRGLEAHDFAQVLQKPEPSHLSCQRRRWLSPKLRASSARRGPPGRLGLAAAVLCALPRAAGPPCAVSTGWLALLPLPRPRPDTRSPPTTRGVPPWCAPRCSGPWAFWREGDPPRDFREAGSSPWAERQAPWLWLHRPRQAPLCPVLLEDTRPTQPPAPRNFPSPSWPRAGGPSGPGDPDGATTK